MHTDPVFTSLTAQLKAVLGFQERTLVDSLQQVTAGAVKSGAHRGSRFPIAIANAYGAEVERRAEVVAGLLRQTRASWAPKHLLESQEAYRAMVMTVLQDDLSQAANLAERIAGFHAPAQDPSCRTPLALFRDWSDKYSKFAASQVEGVIMEVINAAAQDMAAREPSERPSYVFNSTFHAPVASVAQGSASIGSIMHTVSAPTVRELADAVAQLVCTLPNDGAEKAELEAAHGQLEQGKIPFGRMCGALTALSKVADLTTRAPLAFEAMQRLGRVLGM